MLQLNLQSLQEFWQNLTKNEITELCKGVHCVDLGESFPTNILLQNLASIQARTISVKFARSPRTDPPGGLHDGYHDQRAIHMCCSVQVLYKKAIGLAQRNVSCHQVQAARGRFARKVLAALLQEFLLRCDRSELHQDCLQCSHIGQIDAD